MVSSVSQLPPPPPSQDQYAFAQWIYQAYTILTNTLQLAGVTVPMSIANGGTNATTLAQAQTNLGIPVIPTPVSSNLAFLSQFGSTPVWSSATYPASTTINQLLYSSAANTITGLATANSSFLQTNVSGAPSWSALTNILQSANNLSDVTNKPSSALNLFSTNPINTGTTLTSTAFGQVQVCTGASAYTITLPTVTSNSNKYIDFIFNPTSNALVTITPASGTIDGQTSLVYGANEGCRLFCDGTNWHIVWQKLQPVVCRAYLNGAAQTFTNATLTKLNFDAVTYDIGSFFDTATNHRYTPKYPGKYKVYSTTLFLSLVANTPLIGIIEKNSSVASEKDVITGGAAGNVSIDIADTISMNGTTDFLEIFYQQSTGASKNANNSNTQTYVTFERISNF